MNYDIIGDIHGHGDKLQALLRKLGYRQRAGAWRQAGHQVLFVGDYIDRGPQQLATVDTVRAMVGAGSARAVMGNHEFNAIAWSLPDPQRPGEFMRTHTAEKRHQHEAFLAATEDNPARRAEILEWFLQLPLWLDLPELRVVHACWDEEAMAQLAPLVDAHNCLDTEGVRAASRRGTDEFVALERVLKGPEVELPDALRFRQGDQWRSEARLCWWKPESTGLRDAVLVDSATRPQLSTQAIPEAPWPRYAGDRPIFIGHYWMPGTPEPLTPWIACLDYSVGKGGPLVGYRWQGERVLDAAHFVAVR